MLDNLAGYNIILASNSPRRNDLMNGLGIKYTVHTLKDVDESYTSDLKGGDIAQFIASRKADAFRRKMQPNDLVITADTIVCIGDEVLGKPIDKADAVRMLKLLSGKSHWVYTGVCITSRRAQKSFTAATEVVFAPLTEEEILWYVDHYKPSDKAGAYGVQEWIGYVGVERISGSYYNVMGLPVHQLYTELNNYEPF